MKTFDEYEKFVNELKIYPREYSIVYPALGIAGEAGEIAEKIKKWMRGDGELNKNALLLELGDPLWYIVALANDLGFTLQDVIDANVEKTRSRRSRNVVMGDGDYR